LSLIDGAGADRTSRRGASALPVGSIAFLIGVWLWLAFSSGSRLAGQWLLPVLVLALFGLVVAILIAYPRPPRQLSLAVIGLLGSYSVWAGASMLWGVSTGRSWLEAGRTFAYLLVLALALTYFTASSARAAFRYLLLAAAFIVLALCLWRLWSTTDLPGLFASNRLSFPAGQPDNAAAVFLVSFWPLMWLASGPKERAPIRGAALGLATGLLGLAVLTHSRSATWSMAVTALLMFLLSPARLRLLLYILVPAMFMAYAFPQLNKYWVEGPGALAGGPAARTLVVAALAAASIGMILSLLEKWVRVSGRMKAIFGTVILTACVAGLVYGAVDLTTHARDPFGWISQAWREFTIDGSGPMAAPSNVPGQPHSATLAVLGGTDIVGRVLALGGVLLATGGILWPRFASGWGQTRQSRHQSHPGANAQAVPPHVPSRWGTDPRVYGWEMALVVGAAYLFIHTNVQWLWRLPGMSIPAVLMLAAAVAAVDARAGLMWPRANSQLRWKGRRRESDANHFLSQEPLSRAFRFGLIVLSILVLLLAGLAFSSVRI
jgi:hypothetical protein